MSHPVPCASCGANVHVEEDVCSSCNSPRLGDTARTPIGGRFTLLPRWFPTGLIVALALYLGGVWGFLRWEHFHSPEYAASLELEEAERLLGSDDGDTATGEALLRSLDLYVSVLTKFPSEGWIYTRIDTIRWKLGEKKVPVSKETARLLAFVSQGQVNAAEQTSLLESRMRERWDVSSIEALPARFGKLSAIGGLGIVVFYTWWRLQRRSSLGGVASSLDSKHTPHSGGRR